MQLDISNKLALSNRYSKNHHVNQQNLQQLQQKKYLQEIEHGQLNEINFKSNNNNYDKNCNSNNIESIVENIEDINGN